MSRDPFIRLNVVYQIASPPTVIPVLSSWEVVEGKRSRTGRPKADGSFEWRGKSRR